MHDVDSEIYDTFFYESILRLFLTSDTIPPLRLIFSCVTPGFVVILVGARCVFCAVVGEGKPAVSSTSSTAGRLDIVL